jgi:hypothetical protein
MSTIGRPWEARARSAHPHSTGVEIELDIVDRLTERLSGQLTDVVRAIGQ